MVTDNMGDTNSTIVQVKVTGSTTTDPKEVEKEELDFAIISFSALLLIIFLGIIVFLFFRYNHEENSLLNKLKDMESGVPVEPIVVTVEDARTIFCTECGASVPFKYNFCNKCGATLDKEETPEPAKPLPRICPDCGAQVPGQFNFCNKCGTALGTEVNQ